MLNVKKYNKIIVMTFIGECIEGEFVLYNAIIS